MKKLLAIMVLGLLLQGCAVTVDTSPSKQYKLAIEYIKVADYENAEIALKEFIKINPKHKLVSDAQYWYAEILRIKGLYEDAAEAYLVGYEKYPRSRKAPINYLKLGMMLVETGKKKQGCKIIANVSKQYPRDGSVSTQYPRAEKHILERANHEFVFYKCNIN